MRQAETNCQSKRMHEMEGRALGSRPNTFSHMNAAVYGASVAVDVHRACALVRTYNIN